MIVPFSTKTKTSEKESSLSSPDDCLYRLLNDGHTKGYILSLNEEEIKIFLHFTKEIIVDVTIPKKELPRNCTGSPFDYFFGDMYSNKTTIAFDIADNDDVMGTLKFVYIDADPEDRVMIICCGSYPNHLDGFTMSIDEIQRYCEDCNKTSCVEKNKKGE